MTPDRSYQNEGVAFLRARQKAILADDAGLGKSRQVIVAANDEGLDRILVVCPAIGRVSWRTELLKWDDTQRAIAVYKSRAKIPPGRIALIVTYDTFSRKNTLQKFLEALRWAVAFGGDFDLPQDRRCLDGAVVSLFYYGSLLSHHGGGGLMGLVVVYRGPTLEK